MSGEDWRIQTDARDYFRGEQKKTDTEQRRPVIRKASDLVGPGIDAAAVRLTDYNDPLATFNGFFASEPGATYAPNTTDAFAGDVVMDSTLGGVQRFTSLVSGNLYTRVFLRNPGNESSVSFGLWTTPETTVAGLYTEHESLTNLPNDLSVVCNLPEALLVGDPDTYGQASTVITILRPGQYVGSFWMRTTENQYVASVLVEHPNGDAQVEEYVLNWIGAGGIRQPLNFFTTNDSGFVRFTVRQASVGLMHLEFKRLQITRVGDV